MDWHAFAATVRWNIRPFIGGIYKASTANELFTKFNPANETTLCEFAGGSASDIDQAVQVARRRFSDSSWSGLPLAKRAEILRKFGDLIAQNKEEIAILDCLEMGKPIKAALFDAEVIAPTLLRSWIGAIDKLTGEAAPLSVGSIAFNTYEPRGVVGAIAPWNFPSVNAVLKVGPALAAGNSVVLKPSELSCGSALKLAELAVIAGIPEGVFNVVPGTGASAGAALALHSDIDLLSFTGSTVTGRKIMELAGRSNGKPLLLELGGKSPQVVFDDVDNLEAVAAASARGFLWNSGQVCSAYTRLIVHERIKESLLEKVVKLALRETPADPLLEGTSFGPLASPTQRDRVAGFVNQGLLAGAKPVLHGAIQQSGGCYVSPTIFDDVSNDMNIVREEIFGPVLCVQSFKSESEAVALANATAYGLSAMVWTRDIARGRRLAQAIKAGGVSIRTSGQEAPDSGITLGYEPQKASGFGAERGLQGLRSYSTLKVVQFNGA